MKRITFHPGALSEIIEAAEFYEERAPKLGFALLEEMDNFRAFFVGRD